MRADRGTEEDPTFSSRDRGEKSGKYFELKREKEKTKVFSEIEGLYSRRKHLEEVRKFEECDGFSGRI